MGKRERRAFTDEFKQEAVRLTESSGRTITQVADNLGIGLSTLTRWKRRYREVDLLAGITDACLLVDILRRFDGGLPGQEIKMRI